MADTKYTEEQFNKMIDNQFAKHDANGDAQLDKAEAKNLMMEINSKFTDKEWNEEAFEAGFKEADKNGDGFIDKAELHAFLKDRAQKRGMLA